MENNKVLVIILIVVVIIFLTLGIITGLLLTVSNEETDNYNNENNVQVDKEVIVQNDDNETVKEENDEVEEAREIKNEEYVSLANSLELVYSDYTDTTSIIPDFDEVSKLDSGFVTVRTIWDIKDEALTYANVYKRAKEIYGEDVKLLTDDINEYYSVLEYKDNMYNWTKATGLEGTIKSNFVIDTENGIKEGNEYKFNIIEFDLKQGEEESDGTTEYKIYKKGNSDIVRGTFYLGNNDGYGFMESEVVKNFIIENKDKFDVRTVTMALNDSNLMSFIVTSINN